MADRADSRDPRRIIADAITYHPGNRTGTPDQREPVSWMLADAILRDLAAAGLTVVPDDALARERLAAVRDAIRYTADGSAGGWMRGKRLDGLSLVRASEVCPVCSELSCDDDCPLRPIRHQEPTDG